ncbi:hypothetical protein L1049_016631 [Liquidambar formosana]|uniref:Uncharacterized protein n=1 Tax=Liquidambar formosana TaxID=63359 RepID=A0AAP0S6E2_LIQFO
MSNNGHNISSDTSYQIMQLSQLEETPASMLEDTMVDMEAAEGQGNNQEVWKVELQKVSLRENQAPTNLQSI